MKKSILIVEDDENLADSLRSLLEMEGYTVHVCLRAHEALSFLENSIPNLLVIDLMMPLMTGKEFLFAIKGISKLRDIPVILMSASKEPEKKGGLTWTFLQKPFDIDGFLELISKTLNIVDLVR